MDIDKSVKQNGGYTRGKVYVIRKKFLKNYCNMQIRVYMRGLELILFAGAISSPLPMFPDMSLHVD